MYKLFRLIQFSDSAFPVGTFTFSNGLETAAHLGIVHDKKSLESYARTVMIQSAFTDGVGAILAFRAANADQFNDIIKIDNELILFRMNEEARIMTMRMGKKLAELFGRVYGADALMNRWLNEINCLSTPGTYPVALAIAFAMEGLDEQCLFASQQYGSLNMVLSAALRCVRISHYDTQNILFDLGKEIENTYEQAKTMDFENMNCFAPQMEIFASLHEKGQMRMFMN